MRRFLSKRDWIIGILLFATFQTYSQYKRKPKDPIPKPPQYLVSGWLGGFGLTNLLTFYPNFSQEYQNTGRVSYLFESTPNGQIDKYIEFGRYRIINNSYLVRYIDYGIAYKGFEGTESFQKKLQIESEDIESVFSNGTSNFKHHIISANFNANHSWVLFDNAFLQNALGVNLDYTIIAKNNSQINNQNISEYSNSNLTAQLHYKIGFGYKIAREVIMIPSIELPLIAHDKIGEFGAPITLFTSKYQPIILSLRFLLLRKYRMKSCPPVKSIELPEGVNPDTE